MPQELVNCVSKLKQGGKSEQEAYAICTAQTEISKGDIGALDSATEEVEKDDGSVMDDAMDEGGATTAGVLQPEDNPMTHPRKHANPDHTVFDNNDTKKRNNMQQQDTSRAFRLPVPITRAYKDDEGDLYLEGEASNTEVDEYVSYFDDSAQEGFMRDIEDGVNLNAQDTEPVYSEAEHEGDGLPMNNLGIVDRAKLDTDAVGQRRLSVRIKLDRDNPQSVYYYKILTDPDPKKGRPKKLGLSIRGFVIDADQVWDDKLQREVMRYKRVKLTHIGIVRHPGNKSTWVGILRKACLGSANCEIRNSVKIESTGRIDMKLQGKTEMRSEGQLAQALRDKGFRPSGGNPKDDNDLYQGKSAEEIVASQEKSSWMGSTDDNVGKPAYEQEAGVDTGNEDIEGRAKLDAASENALSDSDFALVYTDSKGKKVRKLPIHDESHVRNALARLNQTQFPSPEKKAEATAKIHAKAKKFGIDVDKEKRDNDMNATRTNNTSAGTSLPGGGVKDNESYKDFSAGLKSEQSADPHAGKEGEGSEDARVAAVPTASSGDHQNTHAEENDTDDSDARLDKLTGGPDNAARDNQDMSDGEQTDATPMSVKEKQKAERVADVSQVFLTFSQLFTSRLLGAKQAKHNEFVALASEFASELAKMGLNPVNKSAQDETEDEANREKPSFGPKADKNEGGQPADDEQERTNEHSMGDKLPGGGEKLPDGSQVPAVADLPESVTNPLPPSPTSAAPKPAGGGEVSKSKVNVTTDEQMLTAVSRVLDSKVEEVTKQLNAKQTEAETILRTEITKRDQVIRELVERLEVVENSPATKPGGLAGITGLTGDTSEGAVFRKHIAAAKKGDKTGTVEALKMWIEKSGGSAE